MRVLRTSIGTLAGLVAQSRKLPSKRGHAVNKSDGEQEWFPKAITEYFGVNPWGPTRLLERTLQEWSTARTDFGNDLCIETDQITEWFRISFLRSECLVKGFDETLDLLGFKMTRKEMVSLLAKFFSFALCGKLEEYVKFETSFILAKCLGSETPPIPDFLDWNHTPGTLFCGGLHRKIWMRCSLRRRKQDVSLALSLHRVKAVAEPLLPYVVSEKMKENFEALTQDPPLESVRKLIRHEKEVRRTTRELFYLASNKGWKHNLSTPLPSLHASTETPRKMGGAYKDLLNEDPLGLLGFPFLIGYAREGRRVREVRVPYDPEEVLERLRTVPQVDRISTRRVPILEPFKVRVVSCGQAIPYQLARRYQPSFWSMLQCSEACQLVGTPFTERDVIQSCLLGMCGVHSVMVSGDYKAATDNIDPLLSAAVLDEWLQLVKAPWEDRINLMKTLVGHDIDGVPQSWGQLMGSPISFPVLCIVNLAITRMVQEDAYGWRIPLWWGSIRVNGDDILFPLPPADYQHWVEEMSCAGLTPSLGKNYVSREYVMLNSRVFRLPTDWDRPHISGRWIPELVPQINLGLIRCTDRGMSGSLADWLQNERTPYAPYTMKDCAEESVRGWDADTAGKIITRFIHHARPVLDRLPPMSWFVARERGGLGIPCFLREEDLMKKVRAHHLRIAAYLSVNSDRAGAPREAESLMRSETPIPASVLMALTHLDEIYDDLGVGYSRVTLSNPLKRWVIGQRSLLPEWTLIDKPSVLPVLLRGFSMAGVEVQTTWEREGELLRDWYRRYYRWVKVSEQSAAFLRPMNPLNAIRKPSWKWVRCDAKVVTR